jgi:prophage antirepressor-like protein
MTKKTITISRKPSSRKPSARKPAQTALVPTVVTNDVLKCEVRIITDEKGGLWFVASDVARALGYRSAPNMTRMLDADDISTHLVSSNQRGNPNVTVISESGLYAAIFNSRRTEAKTFKKWVTREVIPSIRKHGGYMRGQDRFSEEYIHAAFEFLEDLNRRALRFYDKETDDLHFTAMRSPELADRERERALVDTAEKYGIPLKLAEVIASGRHYPKR